MMRLATRPPRARGAVLALLFAGLSLSAGALAGCGSGDDPRLLSSRRLATQFHGALIDGDVTALLEICDYPFRLDDEAVAGSEAELEAALKKHLPSMRRAIQASNYLEVVTYEEFVDGKPIAGKSMKGDKARERAKVIGFREGGILIRLYFRDKETGEEDGRGYYLVMHENSVGDLKVTTYHDR